MITENQIEEKVDELLEGGLTMKTFTDLTEQELNTLYRNFVVYRDRFCDGWAKMDIKTFFIKFGLNEYKT